MTLILFNILGTYLNGMGTYAIKDLEKLSGIKAHTIRIWEKRYNILDTKRTETNIRYYDDNDLKNLLNIAFLVNNGQKISKIAALKDGDLNAMVADVAKKSGSEEQNILLFIDAMVGLDEAKFDKAISTSIIKYGLITTMIEVIYPFLERIGVLWQTGSINPAQEHFVSNLVRQKLILATDGLVIKDPEHSKRAILFLPEGELHELGLLFTNYIVRANGCHSLYLGQSLPYRDLLETREMYEPDMLFSHITSGIRGDALVEYLDTLISDFPDATIVVAGLAVSQLATDQIPSSIHVTQSPLEVVSIVEGL